MRCFLPAFTVVLLLLNLERAHGATPAAELRSALSSRGWVLAPHLRSEVGYDSNILARADGEGDAFAVFEPHLSIARRPSATVLSFDLSARFVGFLDATDESSIDPALRARYRYPDDGEALSMYEMDASAAQSSVANPDIGRRIRETDLAFRWEGMLTTTPKTTLRAHLSARRLSYREADLNDNESAATGVLLGFVSNPRMELGAGYTLSLSRSLPAASGVQRSTRVANELTFNGRGEFTSTLSGRWHAGLGHARYAGAIDRTDLDVVAGATLQWALRERLAVNLKADRYTFFSAEGDAVTETSGGVEILQGITGSLRATAGIRALHRSYRRTSEYRKDHAFPLRAGIEYGLTERFSAAFDVTWSTQQSDSAVHDYDRTTVLGRAQYRF